MKNPELWKRISDASPDLENVAFPFARRLARDNGWTENFAQRVILEYLRFAYLSRISHGVVTPSDEVDQAWHLHLTYTKHYWGPFAQALGSRLHHTPTVGGPQQRAHFEAAYNATLALYRDEFGDPPEDIWPSPEVRFKTAPFHRRVNTDEFWVIPKPQLRKLLAAIAGRVIAAPYGSKTLAVLAATAALGTGAALAHGSPAGDTWIEKLTNMVSHWVTEHTVVFLICLAAAALVVWALFQKKTKDGSSGCGGGGCSSGGGDSGCSGCGD
ncbi:hypothetical protein JM93_02556 [Roseibium hamelinense]|uniref:Uncharacterized protein n=1 Tax=Roseibium hamelinense TaxID=150831 RepID=A0A562T125_9HYPH|nr:hypothetical protein [Roseibium hamelinense]MTI44686.1 hypothetical protein [Roseibium hamelinense]TWI87315.1 hypothetical protein JM93_02556 [Roseibium hamelinense]